MCLCGGDVIRTSFAFRRTGYLKQWDNTCIRVSVATLINLTALQYDIVFDGPHNEAIIQINYSILNKILVLELDSDPFWGPLTGRAARPSCLLSSALSR